MPESRMRGINMQEPDADAALRPSAEEKENEITPFQFHSRLTGWLARPQLPVLAWQHDTAELLALSHAHRVVVQHGEFSQFPSAGAIVWITFYRTVDWPSTALPIPPHLGKTSDAIPRMAHL
jgi:hypothetical protein